MARELTHARETQRGSPQMPQGESSAEAKSHASPSPHRERLVARGLTVLGLALAGAGVAAVFTTESDAGAAALLGVGVLLVLFVAIGDRLESLRYGDLELV